jgi:hypothetical protein
MNSSGIIKSALIVLVAFLVAGCGAMIEAAVVGAGKDSTIDDTGFLKSYKELTAIKDPAFPSLPDFSYISPQARIASYNTVVMPDFTSMTTNINKIGGLQVRQYQNIKKQLPDQMANTFDGSAFARVTRINDRIDPRDSAAIKRIPADAVLMGNIKELVSGGGENNAGLTAIQVEYKLVDVKTGEEVLTAIHRSTTDLDKVAMAQVRALAGLLSKAKSATQMTKDASPSVSDVAPVVTNSRTPQSTSAKTTIVKQLTPKEVQERLLALGYQVGKPDGVMGRKTIVALKAFQKDSGIPVTGEIDQATNQKLQEK